MRWVCARLLPHYKNVTARNAPAPIGLAHGFFEVFWTGYATKHGLLGYPSDDAMGVMDVADSSLSGWMRALIEYVRSGEPDLTNRQMALLMLVYLTPGPHTVRGLARMLGVSKPVVTRALNTLGGLGYLRRERDQDDRRNVFVVRTNDGAEFLEGFKRYLSAGQDVGRRESAERRVKEPALADH